MLNNCLPVLSSIWSSKSDKYLCFTKMASECCTRRKSWEHHTKMMNRWHATKPSPCRAHLLESQSWQLASCAEPRGAMDITLSDRCLVWKYIDKELVHVSFWCPNLGFWMYTQDDTCGSGEAIGPWYVSYVWRVALQMLEDEMAWYANLEKKRWELSFKQISSICFFSQGKLLSQRFFDAKGCASSRSWRVSRDR